MKVFGKIILILSISVFFFSFIKKDSNPYVGKWVVKEVRSFKKKNEKIAKQFSDFKSTIVFKSDMTFTKVNKHGKIAGKYEFESNKFTFLEKDSNNTYQKSWSIRVPRRQKLIPNYPELFTLKQKRKEDLIFEFDVYYKKISK